ncbi:MAG: radical SAM protein [Desulfobacter sp.]
MNVERVEFQINWKCNMNCSFCFQNGSREAGEMAMADVVSAMDQLSPGLKIVWITGGEPLLSPALLFSVIRESKRRGLYVGMSSNGLILKTYLPELKAAGLDEIRISLDSNDAAVFERIRGRRNSFPRVMEGLVQAVHFGFRVGIRTTVTRENAATVPGVIETAKQMGVSRVELKSVLPIGRGDRSTMLRPGDLARVFRDTYRQRTRQTDVMIMCNHLPQCRDFNVENNFACQCAREYLYIYSDGAVVPCSYFPALPGLNLRARSLEAIYHGAFFNAVRHSSPEDCRSCEGLDTCRNGCPAVLHRYGRFGNYCYDVIEELCS